MSLPPNDDWRSLPTLEKRAFLERLREQNAASQISAAFRAFQQKYRYDLPGFIQDCFVYGPYEGPTPYQMDIAEHLMSHKRVAVRGPHGIGKTVFASWVTLWAVLTGGSDVKVITTASVWRQLQLYLWPEIHKWAARLRWDVIGREPFNRHELLTELLRLSPTTFAVPVASDNAGYIEGAHARRMVYIFDEAKLIPDATWDAAEGAFSTSGLHGWEVYAVAISTPGASSGRFYDIHSHKPGFSDWWTRHVSRDEAISAGRMTIEWAEQRREQWHEDYRYQNRVLGEFATEDEQAVIPLAWVEAAVKRWYDWDAAGRPGEHELVALGVDVGYTHDKTVFAFRHPKNVIGRLEKWEKEDPNLSTMLVANRIGNILMQHGGKEGPARCIIDSVGIGLGAFQRLKEQKFRKVYGFIAGGGTKLMDRTGERGFVNKRSAAWWTLREYFDPVYEEDIAIPDDDTLIGDLVAPKYIETSGGKIKVEEKADVIKRLMRSPDDADAVMHSFWEESAGVNLA